MKTTLILLALLGTTVTASPQGTINFANTRTTLVSTNAYIGGPAAVISQPAGSYYFALLVAPTNQLTVNNSLVGWTFTGNYATNTSLAGRFSGGSPVVIYAGAPPGQPVNFVVVGWSQNLGHDWAEVLPTVMQGYSMGFVGISGIAANVVPGGWSGTNQWPTPNLPLPAGFTLWLGCLGPYLDHFSLEPINETVIAGSSVEFVVSAVACPPPVYTWFFNGSPIAGGSSYRIASAQSANAGQYFAVASGITPPWLSGSITSVVATLTVLTPVQPYPAAQTAETGSTVGFSVRADGYPTQPYPWFFNNTQVLTSGIGNGTLRLTNIQFSQAGAYTVVLSNALGTVTSLPAVLNVIPPVSRTLVPALAVSGQAAAALDLEFESSLGPPANWSRLDSLDPTNHWYFDLTAPLTAQRFYRARQSNASGVAPALNLYLAPAVTLTGSVGNSLRLDAVNQIGPTYAWWTLDTVTLTNTSQLYFDTSGIGQPARLYRIVPVP